MLKMIDLIIRLGQLGFTMDVELSQDLILQSLPKFFSQFVVNYHMNKLDIFLPELLNILKIAENHIKGEKGPLLMVDKNKYAGRVQRKERSLILKEAPSKRRRQRMSQQT